MDRLTILVCRPNKTVTPTNYFFKVPIISRFMPLLGVIHRPVECRLNTGVETLGSMTTKRIELLIDRSKNDKKHVLDVIL